MSDWKRNPSRLPVTIDLRSKLVRMSPTETSLTSSYGGVKRSKLVVYSMAASTML